MLLLIPLYIQSMKRREFIQQSSMAMAATMLCHTAFTGVGNKAFPVVRVAKGLRKFNSPAVENLISLMHKSIGNKEIAWLFENCFPNTLDTTVDFEIINGKPDTFVITGDIDAMWLRDSSAQVWPYLPLMKEDKALQQLIKGVINRQVKCILKDPYANAFYKDENKISEWKNDKTLMKPGIHERKWEIDSLCYPIRLAHGYWVHTGDTTAFDDDWRTAMKLIIKTFKEQQRLHNNGPYQFERTTSWATDGVPMGGFGYPTKKTGLIHSMFRASDDATVFAFNIPENMFALTSISNLMEIYNRGLNDDASFLQELKLFQHQLSTLLAKSTVHTDFGTIWPYETNGLGSINLMDDANVPSLLSLPYLGCVPATNEVYKRTRKFVLSNNNPFFFKGTMGEGIGGPHIGLNYIWPMSIIMRGLTSADAAEIKNCLQTLQHTHAGTGFMHESFYKDDAAKYTRKWFAWANTLFGEFVWKVQKEFPYLLQ